MPAQIYEAPPLNMRKTARQERAQTTIASILEAATQLLEERSIEELTTNHIAKRAGVSIGTLYQYFPNKFAVVDALVSARNVVLAERLNNQLETLNTDDIQTSVPLIIKAIIRALTNGRADRELSLWMMMQKGTDAEGYAYCDSVAETIENRIKARLGKDDPRSAIMTFVMTRATLGALRSAMLERPELLHDELFVEEISNLITGTISGLR